MHLPVSGCDTVLIVNALTLVNSLLFYLSFEISITDLVISINVISLSTSFQDSHFANMLHCMYVVFRDFTDFQCLYLLVVLLIINNKNNIIYMYVVCLHATFADAYFSSKSRFPVLVADKNILHPAARPCSMFVFSIKSER